VRRRRRPLMPPGGRCGPGLRYVTEFNRAESSGDYNLLAASATHLPASEVYPGPAVRSLRILDIAARPKRMGADMRTFASAVTSIVAILGIGSRRVASRDGTEGHTVQGGCGRAERERPDQELQAQGR
jgi:hypothetical protein